MSTELDPSQLHAKGLEASLSNRLSEADILLTQARMGFLEAGANIDVGRVDRDRARVFAGLGEPALRNSVIKSAFDIHWDAFTKDDENTTHAASELAATQHVHARVDLAISVENGSFRAPKMARDWHEAYRLLRQLDMNEDYLQQVIAHGSLAVTTFGRRGDLCLAADLLRDPEVKQIEDARRREAVRVANQLLLARQLFVPVALVPQIRDRVIGAVAGPYLTKG